MKFRYVQTRVVRYVVVIEAPSMDMADDFVLLHDEWEEAGIESEDPPWRENCDQDEVPDLTITAEGEMIPLWEMRQRELGEKK